jgi:hypothetical protein
MSRHERLRLALFSPVLAPLLLAAMATPAGASPAVPLVPGTQFVLQGTVTEPDGTHVHRVETTVTDLTKMTGGVRTIVVFDRDFDDGQLVESELFFNAQDGFGRVWNLGEYPEEYERGRLVGAPSTWISGVRGAKAGIGMLARPRVGDPTYLQGLSPTIDFKDCATVFRTGQRTCTPVKCFNDVLVTDEFSPLDPEGGHQRKFYAPGVGNIRVDAVGGDAREVLDLVKLRRLCPSALASIRDAVLKQDDRGYRIAGDVYRHTSPAKRTLQAGSC